MVASQFVRALKCKLVPEHENRSVYGVVLIGAARGRVHMKRDMSAPRSFGLPLLVSKRLLVFTNLRLPRCRHIWTRRRLSSHKLVGNLNPFNWKCATLSLVAQLVDREEQRHSKCFIVFKQLEKLS